MKGLDTNVLVRYLTQDDPEQSKKANALIEETASKGDLTWINSVVLCELVRVLRGAYGHDKREIVSVLEKMLSVAQFLIEDKDIARKALEEYRDGDGDFADHLIGWRNRKSGCEKTFTFNRRLKKSEMFQVL